MIAVLLSVLVGAAPVQAAAEPTAPYPLADAHKTSIAKAVGGKLLDDSSARFRWPPHQAKFGRYCGWVNAKNIYGAYTGYKLFLVVGGVTVGSQDAGKYSVYNVVLDTDDARSMDSGVARKLCSDAGYEVDEPPTE